MRKTILTTIITALIGHISANAAEKTATWRISETGASRSGDSFNNEKTGDIQRIVLQPAGKVRAITSAKTKNFGKSISWSGGVKGFLYTVKPTDDTGIYRTKFFGCYQIASHDTGGINNENQIPDWSFDDTVAIARSGERSVEATDTTDDPVILIFPKEPRTTYIEYDGADLNEVKKQMSEYQADCQYSITIISEGENRLTIGPIPKSAKQNVKLDGQNYPYFIGCHLKKIGVQVDVQYTMPKWTKLENSSEEDAIEWNRYYQTLRKHEEGHAEITIAIGRKLCDTLQNIRSNGYAQSRNRASFIATSDVKDACSHQFYMCMDILKAFQIEYDKVTDHGHKQSKWTEDIKNSFFVKYHLAK